MRGGSGELRCPVPLDLGDDALLPRLVEVERRVYAVEPR